MRKAALIAACAVVAIALTVPALALSSVGAVALPQSGERARSPGAPSILVYDSDDANHPWQTALDALGVAYTHYGYGEGSSFLSALGSGTWDLVCVNEDRGGLITSNLDALETYLDGGGNVIVFVFNIQSYSANPLWAKMGAQWEANLTTYEALAGTDTGHSIWSRSQPLPATITGSDIAADNGDYLSALPGARLVAYSNTNNSTHGRIVCREDHRSVLNAFLAEDYLATDSDADGLADVVELMMNEVIYVVNDGWSILVYEDYSNPTIPSFPAALDELGLIYRKETNLATFTALLGSTSFNWDLVCAYTPNNFDAASRAALNSHLTGGGQLIVSYWDIDASPADPLWATMGAAWQSSISTAADVSRWPAYLAHPLFTLPRTCPDLVTPTRPGDYGDYVEAQAGALGMAGLAGDPPDPTKARLVMRIDGRSILDTFMPYDYGGTPPQDADLDGVADITEWLWNQVAMAGGHMPYTYHIDDRAKYSFEDISSTGTALAVGDEGEATINLPFNFMFYGLRFTQLRVGANGCVGFDDGANIGYFDWPLPTNRHDSDPTLADRFLAPMWCDLNPAGGGAVYWEVRGSAPWRRVIIEWHDVPPFGGSTGSTFEIVLYENWNYAVCYYADMAGLQYGHGATVGLQNSFSQGVQYSNNEAIITDGLGVVMTPLSHTFGVTDLSASPSDVVSGGTVNLSGGYFDYWLHDTSSWTWSRDPAIGAIDNPSAKTTTWTAPMNNGTSDIVVTFTANATCNGHEPLSDSDSIAVTLKWDYDGDGMKDTWELANALNPQSAADGGQDPDNDALTNLEEYQHNTDPHSVDSDGDGFRDMTEVWLGSDPADASSKPAAGHFDDVAASPLHWAFNEVEAMVRLGITSGCSVTPPLYCPNSSITRAQMAVFIIRAMGETPYANPTPAFEDVPSGHWAYGYIERMNQLHITTGCSTDPPLYCPNSAVTRAQMAVFLCRAAGKAWLDKATPTFADVPATHWAYGYIERLADPDSWGGTAVTSGCATGPPRLYCPSAMNTRAQMAVFLLRAFETAY